MRFGHVAVKVFDPSAIASPVMHKLHDGNTDQLKRRISELESILHMEQNEKETLRDNLNTSYYVIKCLTDHIER